MVFISKLYVITLCMSCIKSYMALLRDLSIFLERVLTPTYGGEKWYEFLRKKSSLRYEPVRVLGITSHHAHGGEALSPRSPLSSHPLTCTELSAIIIIIGVASQHNRRWHPTVSTHALSAYSTGCSQPISATRSKPSLTSPTDCCICSMLISFRRTRN